MTIYTLDQLGQLPSRDVWVPERAADPPPDSGGGGRITNLQPSAASTVATATTALGLLPWECSTFAGVTPTTGQKGACVYRCVDVGASKRDPRAAQFAVQIEAWVSQTQRAGTPEQRAHLERMNEHAKANPTRGTYHVVFSNGRLVGAEIATDCGTKPAACPPQTECPKATRWWYVAAIAVAGVYLGSRFA